MATAFHEIVPPTNFGVILYDNDDYLTLKVDTEELLKLSETEREDAVKYINNLSYELETIGKSALQIKAIEIRMAAARAPTCQNSA